MEIYKVKGYLKLTKFYIKSMNKNSLHWDVESILNKTNSSDVHSTNTFLCVRPDFQREFRLWSLPKRSRYIETILRQTATNPIWVVYNDERNCNEVVDGMHRLLHVLEFVQNKWVVKLNGRKIKYEDLDGEQKQDIKNYQFTVNILESSIRSDPHKLQELIENLNNCSKALNRFELQKIFLKDFYKILDPFVEKIAETVFYKYKYGNKGQAHRELMKCLALSEPIDFNSEKFTPSCYGELIDSWIENNLSFDPEKIKKNLELKKEEYQRRLEMIFQLLSKFGNLPCHHEKRDLVLAFMICRLVGRNKLYDEKLKRNLFLISTDELEEMAYMKKNKKYFWLQLLRVVDRQVMVI